MADNVIAKKTEDFAVRIVKLWKYLTKSKEYEMSNQIRGQAQALEQMSLKVFLLKARKTLSAR